MNRFDNLLFGLFTGIIGTIIGIFVFFLLQYFSMGLGNFLAFIFHPDNRSIVLAPVISLGAIFNLAIFFFYLNRRMYKAGNGIILALFVCIVIVLILKS